MKELINITEKDGQQVVSARELYLFFEVKGDFTTWAKRMFEYGFEEEKDFTSFLGRSSGGRPSSDYALTMDTAKEISMLQRSGKGKQARQYFIAMEKKAIAPFSNLSKLDALRLAVEQEEKILIQENTIKEQAPKVIYHDKVLKSNSSYTTTLIAKELGTSATALNRKLKDLGIQYKQSGTWVLYAKYQDKGYTDTTTYTYTDSVGVERTSMLTTWTELGRKWIHAMLSREDAA